MPVGPHDHGDIIEIRGTTYKRHFLFMPMVESRMAFGISRMASQFDLIELIVEPGGTTVYGLLPPDQEPILPEEDDR